MKKLLVFFSWGVLAFSLSAAVKVDILIAFDSTSVAWLDGRGMTQEAFAAAQIAKANEVIVNSGLDDAFEFRLAGVYSAGFSYNASVGIENTLLDVLDGTAGEWSNDLKTARDAAGADIVAIIVETGQGSYGVLGYSNIMLPKVGTTDGGGLVRQWGLDFPAADEYLKYFSEGAYCICDIEACESDFTFVHEVGHVMGAGHSELISPDYDLPGPQLDKYSAAMMYEGSDGKYYATVMGYNTTGYNGSPTYEVLPFFSSPSVKNPFTNEPLGDATHDNVRTLRETCGKVAAFRAAVIDDDGGDVDDGGGELGPAVKTPGGEFVEKKTDVTCAILSGGDVAGTVTFTVSKTKKGVSKVSAVVFGLDGKKVKSKAGKCEVFLNASGVAAVEYDSEVKGYSGRMYAVIAADGTVAVDSNLAGMSIVAAESGGLKEGASHGFYLADTLLRVGNTPVLQLVTYENSDYNLLPYAGNPEPLLVAGDKWTVAAKAGKVKSKKNRNTGVMETIVDMGKDGSKTNLSALKVSFARKTGSFKGTFTAYTEEGGKVKKYKFKVGGVVVNGVGYGQAVNSKTKTVVRVSVY